MVIGMCDLVSVAYGFLRRGVSPAIGAGRMPTLLTGDQC